MSQEKFCFIQKILLYRWKKDFTFEYFRDKLLRKPASLLHSLNISPNALSIMGVAFVIIAVLSLKLPFVAATLMIINLVADGLDGVVARLYHLDSYIGSIVDTICDTLGSVIIVLGLSLFYKLDLLQIFLWVLSIIFYSIITALYSIKVEKRSKVIGFRNVINIGAIILLTCLGFQVIEVTEVSTIMTSYMHSISVILAILSLYTLLRMIVHKQ